VYSGDPTTAGITAKIGGSITYDGYNGYMIADLSPDDTSSGVTFTGTLSGSFLTERMMGIPELSEGVWGISGDLFGSYSTTDYTWQAAGVGTWSGGALSHVSTIDTGFGMFYHKGTSYQNDGSLGGLIGGTDSLWGATKEVPALLTAIGPYTAGSLSGQHVWGTNIISHNYVDNIDTTYDEGAYVGYMVGGHNSGSLQGKMVAFYIDPDGNAGYLNGSMNGMGYSDINMFEMTGSAYTTQMAAVEEVIDAEEHNIPASDLSDNYWAITSDRHIINSAGSFYDGGGAVVGAINGACPDGVCATDTRQAAINNQSWGIWRIRTGGNVTGTTSDSWSWSGDWANAPIEPTWSATSLSGGDMAGSKWSDSKITGTTVGYGASVQAAPMTWVSVGEVIGTYNPGNPNSSFQMVAMGPWIETGKFLDMVNTNPTALTNLNIPCVNVGTANITGSAGDTGSWTSNALAISMDDVKFFSYSSGNAPKIWATGSVGGQFGGNPVDLVGGVALKIGTETVATFTAKQWTNADNGKWLGQINGNGANSFNLTAPVAPANPLDRFAGNVKIDRGAAAGSVNTTWVSGTAGAFSGTAAGVAKPSGGGGLQ